MFKVFMTIYIVVASVLSCHAKNCCYPDQFESTIKQVLGFTYTTGTSDLTTADIFLSFDKQGKRMYVNEDVYVDERIENIVQLQLYEQGVQYTVFNKTCSKTSLGPWTNEHCIPDYAVKLPTSTLGMEPSIKVNDYYWKVGDLVNTVTVTSDNCVPVFEQSYWSFLGDIMMGATKVENVTSGIKNPDIFDVPDICKHIQVNDEIATRRPLFPNI